MYLLNAFPVLEMKLSIPRMGTYSANLLVSTDSGNGNDLTAPVLPGTGDHAVLTVDSSTFACTVLTSNTQAQNRAIVRVVGGTGGLPKLATAQNYGNGPTLNAVVSGMLSSAGEAFNPGLSSPALLTAALASWQVLSNNTWGQNLTRLMQKANSKAAWRVDPATGTAYVTIDTFLTSARLPSLSTVDEASYSGGTTFECPALDSLPVPGTLDPTGKPVHEVVVLLHSGKLQISSCCRSSSAKLFVQQDRH